MTDTHIGMLISGIIPSFLFAIGAVFQKLSNKTGLVLSIYLIFVGLGVILTGLISFWHYNNITFSLKGCSFAMAQGLCFGSGILLFSLGIVKYELPISQLSPLVATTSLFSIFLGFIIFAEYTGVNVFKLTIGSILIVLGVIIVSNS